MLEKEENLKIVFDTNIWISSTLWKGSVANKLLAKLIENGAEIYTSLGILDEYAKVLKRDFYYSEEEIDKLVYFILSFAFVVEPEEKVFVVKEDPADNKIIECAMESGAEYILSYDRHLLDLGGYKGILMVRPEDFT